MTRFLFPREAALIAVAAFVGMSRAPAAELAFSSGSAHVALIELYTSEGCSSCPPAEKWLGERRDDPGLWRDFVPVAFHVNYWDHLGWRDALASKAFTDREHAYAAAWRSDSVYTPCFVRDGAEWRPGRDGGTKAATNPAAGTLRLTSSDGTRWRVEFTPAPGTRDSGYTISAALLGGGIVSAVRAGENRGRELRHEFVALQLENAPLAREGGGAPKFVGEVTLTPRSDVKSARLAIAAWITRRGELAPLQAAGGWVK